VSRLSPTFVGNISRPYTTVSYLTIDISSSLLSLPDWRVEWVYDHGRELSYTKLVFLHNAPHRPSLVQEAPLPIFQHETCSPESLQGLLYPFLQILPFQKRVLVHQA